MSVYRTILMGCLALVLSSCAATPVLTGKGTDLAREIRQKAPAVGQIAVSPDGRYVIASSFNSFTLWDIGQGKKVQTFNHESGMGCTVAAAFSPDGKYFASGAKGVRLWDMATRQQLRILDNDGTVSLAFSPDGKYLLCANVSLTLSLLSEPKPSGMKIIDVATGRIIREVTLRKDFPVAVSFSPDGRYALSGGGGGIVHLWEASLERMVSTATGSESSLLLPGRINAVSFSPDGRYVLSGAIDNSVILWNAANLTEVKKFTGHTEFGGIGSVDFSPDGKSIVSTGWSGRIKIWDLATASVLKAFNGNIVTTQAGTAAKFSPQGKTIFSAGDASTRIWDAATGEEIASMIDFEDGEWIITTANGYYTSSPRGDKYLSVSVGGREYSTEQLRESFYRPDLVQVAISGGSLAELKKVADVKPPPAVAIVNPPKNTDKSDWAITLRITDAGGGIGDIRLYLNGSAVLLDSARGVKVLSAVQNEILKTYQLKLVSGVNAVRAIAFNADNTMQSSDAVHEITAAFKAVGKPSLYALVIGINEYKNPKLQLNYAVADATLFAMTLREGASSLFEKVEVKKLSTWEETTRENVLKELQAMQRLNPDDLFVFYVASHGTVDDGEYFLITSNVGSLSTPRLKTDAVSQNTLKELIANIPATKKLIVIDTCSAGKLGDVIQTAMMTRGMSEDTAMKVLSRAVGSTILSASTSVQEALEGYNGHGLFTYVLAEGLAGRADKSKSGFIKTTELADYVDNEVPALAEKVFKRAQYPTISISGQGFPIGKAR